MPLLNPGESSYKQDDIVERIVNNELVRMESILSDFLTNVYHTTFGEGRDAEGHDTEGHDTEGHDTEGHDTEGGIADSDSADASVVQHRVHVSFPRHVKFEHVRDMYDRQMFDAEFLGQLALQSQGMDEPHVKAKKYKVEDTGTERDPPKQPQTDKKGKE